MVNLTSETWKIAILMQFFTFQRRVSRFFAINGIWSYETFIWTICGVEINLQHLCRCWMHFLKSVKSTSPFLISFGIRLTIFRVWSVGDTTLTYQRLRLRNRNSIYFTNMLWWVHTPIFSYETAVIMELQCVTRVANASIPSGFRIKSSKKHKKRCTFSRSDYQSLKY